METYGRPCTDFAKIVSQQYENIKNTVRVSNTIINDMISVNISSKMCDKNENDLVCKNVKEGISINFQAKLAITKDFCRLDTDLPNDVSIELDGFQDKLDIDVTCQTCEGCDNKNAVQNANQCSGKGTLICGGCRC